MTETTRREAPERIWLQHRSDLKMHEQWSDRQHFDNDIEYRRADLPASVGGDGWMPIETAPKDGTRVLLCDSQIRSAHSEAYIGWWTDDAYAENGGKGGPAGWLSNIPGDHVSFDCPIVWQPLPTPPGEKS